MGYKVKKKYSIFGMDMLHFRWEEVP